MNDVRKEKSHLIFQDGLHLLQTGKFEEADNLFLQAHQLNPDNLDAINLLGIRSYQKKDFKQALTLLNRSNYLRPNSAETLSNLGLVYDAMAQFDNALDCFNTALKIKSDTPEIFNNLGNTLKNLNRSEEAKSAYACAITLRPNYPEALSNQGTILLAEGSVEQAIFLFQKAISANSNFAPGFNNLGNAFTQLEQYENAFECFEKALQIQPNYIEACLNFGNALKKSKQYSAAINCYQHALKIDLNNASILFLLGETYYEIGQSALAKNYYGKCLDITPSNLVALYALTISQIPKVYRNQEEIDTSREAFSRQLEILNFSNHRQDTLEISASAFSRHPFYLAYQAQNNKPLLSKYGCTCIKEAKSIQSQINLLHRQSKTNAKMRLGIISHYFCDHPVWHALTKGLVRQLDSELFDIYLFNTGGAEDDETLSVQSSGAKYINCGKSLTASAKTIAETNLDALIYPEIGMDPTSKGLACLRLAPLQAVSWGHPETTGLTTIDYFLSSELLEPDNGETFYSEKLIRLPSLGTYLEHPPIKAIKPNFEGLEIDRDTPILICAGSPSKYNPINDSVFVQIAQMLGRCQFIFFNFDENLTEALRERLNQSFSDANLNSNKYIRIIPFLKREEFFGLLHEADLYLDTIGFSGFNTALQALVCDLPVVTIEGTWMRARLGSAILNKLGLGEFVCKSSIGYIDLVVKLIRNKELRETYKSKIIKYKETIFRDTAPIKYLEKFLIQQTKNNHLLK